MNLKKKTKLNLLYKSMKLMNVEQLISFKGICERYPESDPDRILIETQLKKEFEKRKLNYDNY